MHKSIRNYPPPLLTVSKINAVLQNPETHEYLKNNSMRKVTHCQILSLFFIIIFWVNTFAIMQANNVK